MELDPAPRPRQPLLHEPRMVVAGIVEKDVDQAFAGIHQHDRHQQRDRAQGIDRRHVDHAGGAGFQVDGAVNVEPLPAAGLFNRDFGVLRRPAAGRPRLVRRMHGIGEQHGFIIAESC